MDNNIHNSQNDSEWKNSFSKVNEWESLPPLDGWDKISEQLDKSSRPKFLYWFLALGLILVSSLGIGLYIISSENNISSPNFTCNTTNQTVKKETNMTSDIEKSDTNSATENSTIQSDINKNTKSNVSENQINNSISNTKKTLSNETTSSKVITKSSRFSQKATTQENVSKNIGLTTDLSSDDENNEVVNITQENLQETQAEITAVTQEDKKMIFVLEEKSLGEIKTNADPFFEMQIDSIKIVSNDNKKGSLNLSPLTKDFKFR
ncbi:hypothetical protein WAF17_07780 [Bernardetia sp. ABR2-2B]|uniref:hypothetical protein n=1 Tax=Bernardetia sp. ABR2-2B TaxID=3127472 RepID=UPI0030CC5B59